jgi:hypothetical protein
MPQQMDCRVKPGNDGILLQYPARFKRPIILVSNFVGLFFPRVFASMRA